MKPKPSEWDRCHRNPKKLDTQIKRSCREKDIPLDIRQNGTSHKVYSVPDGSVSIPQHEIPKGTWGSIWRTLVALGIAALPFVIFIAHIKGVL